MKKKFMCLFLMGILMVTSLTELEACKMCGNPVCPGYGYGGHPHYEKHGGHHTFGGCHGGHHTFGGCHGGHHTFGGCHGGHHIHGGGCGECGGYGGYGEGYPVPYPVVLPVPMPPHYELPSHYASPYHGLLGPIHGGYYDDDFIPRRRMCRCHINGGYGKRYTAHGGRGRGYYY